MNTLRKNLWVSLCLIFVLFICSVNVKADSEFVEAVGEWSSFEIVGGTPVNPGAYPWIAQIGYDHPRFGDLDIWCGGALIDRSWVLSAAHCFDDTTASRYTLTLGEHEISENEGTEQIIDVEEIIIHPDYQDTTGTDNDIALLHLASPAQLNDRVGIVQLGTLPGAATPLTVIGWGSTSQGGAVSDILLQTHVPLRTNTDCSNAYPGRITDSMFCAGFDEGEHDSCQGDSGGPIFFDEGGGEWRQVGIVSWGDGCAVADKFGVYTSVTRFTDWINNSIGRVDEVPTPNVIGQAQAAAEAVIVSKELTVGLVTTANHQSVQAGNVISQNPTGGTMVAQGSTVDLVVSLGPPEVKIIPISPPFTQGSISEAGGENLFTFTVETGGSCTIETKGETVGIDTVVSLFGPANQTTPIHENDDIGGGNRNSRITASLEPGTYHVKVKLYKNTPLGDYTIFVRSNE